MPNDRCARCGKPAEGSAAINGERFCHGDYAPGERTCYMEESHRLVTGQVRTRMRVHRPIQPFPDEPPMCAVCEVESDHLPGLPVSVPWPCEFARG